MPEYDTCFYWSGESCIFDDDCPHRGPGGECLADDEDLLTWEDYQQRLEITRHSAKLVQESSRSGKQ